jgi:hypothetical protein
MSEDIENSDDADQTFVRILGANRKEIGSAVNGTHYNKDTPKSFMDGQPDAMDSLSQSVLDMAPQFALIGQFYGVVEQFVGVTEDGVALNPSLTSMTEDSTTQSAGWAAGGGKH